MVLVIISRNYDFFFHFYDVINVYECIYFLQSQGSGSRKGQEREATIVQLLSG